MKTRHTILLPVFVFFAAMLTQLAEAQWKTETFTLKEGWNAIYPLVDSSDRTIDSLIFDEHTQIVAIHRWNPDAVDGIALENPASPDSAADWSVWDRFGPDTMTRLHPYRGYLVKVEEGSADITLEIKGRVVMPRIRWRNDGLNLLGFPVDDENGAPAFNAFLAPARIQDQQTSIFRYSGGELDETNPVKLFNTAAVTMERGKAYWINTQKYSDYYGPVSIESSLGAAGCSYGSSGVVRSLIFSNRTDRVRTVTLDLTPSEDAPSEDDSNDSGYVLAELLLEDAATGDYGEITWPLEFSIPAEGRVEKTFALNRGDLLADPGIQAGAILTATDDIGLAAVDIPVSAISSGITGLWVGEAVISKVQNRLQRFERDPDTGDYKYDEETNERIPLAGSGDTSLNDTEQGFPIRLILHVDETGGAKLLSNVYGGLIATNVVDQAPVFGLTTVPDQLDPEGLKDAVRLTAVHFPLDTNKDLGGGNFGAGASLNAEIPLDLNAKDNPFIHTFHPDHDNLTANFAGRRPAGIESFTVNRDLTITFDAVGPAGDPGWGSRSITGTYTEEITGIHKNSISVEGQFELRRLSEIDTLIEN